MVKCGVCFPILLSKFVEPKKNAKSPFQLYSQLCCVLSQIFDASKDFVKDTISPYLTSLVLSLFQVLFINFIIDIVLYLFEQELTNSKRFNKFYGE